MSDDKMVAVKSDVQRLLDATIIREVMYPKWLANTVPIEKKNGKWRMCVDFRNLNKATPKDNYPLPRMDQVVDFAANTTVMSLLDCFSGLHQCWMANDDEEKTSFITPFGSSTRPDKQPHSIVNAMTSVDWRAPIIAFHRGHYEPVETHDFKRMQAQARGYILK
jgi:hypothetical protein